MKKTKNKKKPNKKPGYKLSKQKQYTEVIKPGLGPIVPRLMVTLKYCGMFNQGGVTTVTGFQQVMSLNGIYDPDITGTGHQPNGFDLYSNIYTFYRVRRTKWKIYIQSTNDRFATVVVPFPLQSLTGTSTGTYNTLCELPFSKVGTAGYNCNHVPSVFKGNFAMNFLAGITNEEYEGDDNWKGKTGSLTGSNPPNQIYLMVGFYNNSSSTITIGFQITMYYEVEFLVPFNDLPSLKRNDSSDSLRKEISNLQGKIQQLSINIQTPKGVF